VHRETYTYTGKYTRIGPQMTHINLPRPSKGTWQEQTNAKVFTQHYSLCVKTLVTLKQDTLLLLLLLLLLGRYLKLDCMHAKLVSLYTALFSVC
jgi:hypothetical protein